MVSIRNFTVAGGRHGTAAMVPSSRGGETALGREFASNMRIFRHGTDTFASPKFLTRGVLEPVDADFGATDDRGFIDGATRRFNTQQCGYSRSTHSRSSTY